MKENRTLWVEFTTGWLTKKHIEGALVIFSDTSLEFKEFICQQLETINPSLKNIRQPIKNILTWPHKDYAKWIEVDDSNHFLSALNSQSLKGQIKLVDGKIHCMLPGLVDFITKFDLRTTVIKDITLVPNTIEGGHITLVNSNIVASLEERQLLELIESQPEIDDIVFSKLKHTCSIDWSLFSICLVVEIDSKKLNQFIDDFNQKTGKNVHPSLHTTIAILPR